MIPSLLSGHWLPLVLNIALQSLLFLGVAAVALACNRKASAARRHLISMAALGALLLIPFMPLVIPTPKPMFQVSGNGLDLQRSPAGPRTASAVNEPNTGIVADSDLTTNSEPATGKQSASSPVASGSIASYQATTGIRFPAALSSSLLRFVPWLATLWLTGVLLVLGRLLIGFDRLRRISRESEAVLSAPLQNRIQEILVEVGFRRPLAILQASSRNPISVPMTWGLRAATLLLPTDAAEWPAERLRVVLLHELAHIRRHDWLTQMFGQVICALYWFHPLIWLLNRRAQIEAECACDDAVLLTGVRAKDYATSLLEVVKAMQTGREAPFAAVSMARPTQVRYRIQSILNAQRNRQSPTRSVMTMVLSVTVFLLCAASWFRPLAWAGGNRQATEANPMQTTGPMVTLPNGISVELNAVGSDPMGFGDDWWTSAGKPLLEPPAYSHPVFRGTADPFGTRYLRRALFFRLRTPQKANVSVTGYIVDPTQHLQTDGYRYGRNAQIDAGEIEPNVAAGGIMLLGFPQKDSRCTYRFGIADAPWQTIATTRFALHPTPNAISIPATAIPTRTVLYSDDNPRIQYFDRGSEHILSLLGGHAPLSSGDVARRIVALDKDGKEVVQQNYDYEVPRGAGPLPLWAQARIVEFRLQTRPYQWAEFKNIHLEHLPIAKVAPVATPPALPEFRHTFTNGVTMTVSAVTESRKEGGLWWQPDGTSLGGPLKDWPAVSFPNWGQKLLPRVVLFQLQSPRTLSYTAAIRFAGDRSDDQTGLPPGFESQIEKGRTVLTWWPHDFPQHLPPATMRYGIAVGPWKPVASIPMPQDVRHSDGTTEPSWSDLLLETPGYPEPGETPRLSYTTAAGKALSLPFTIQDTSYLSDVARRFVAVTRDGKILLLRSNNLSHAVLDAAGQPILLDPANAGKTDLRSGDYKRREFEGMELAFHSTSGAYKYNPIDLTKIREFRLEVRPYEWAEFPNIALQPKTGAPIK